MNAYAPVSYTALVLAQSTGQTPAEAPAGQQPQVQPWFQSIWLLLIPMALFYVLLILPEKRKRAETTKRLAAIKKNDRVVTIGGIHGVVVQATPESEEVVIRVDESTGTRLRMNRSAIALVVGGDDSGEKTS